MSWLKTLAQVVLIAVVLWMLVRGLNILLSPTCAPGYVSTYGTEGAVCTPGYTPGELKKESRR